jgi:glyoxylase-like metal-dependent hydrolase (beta-lactamase superfamily II)
MTLDGTRTFLLGRERPLVIDPGPDDARHLAAILGALGGATPAAILLTHSHGDHSAAAPALARATGAPLRMGRGALSAGIGALPLAEGERLESDAGALVALATPGHAPEHFAFHWPGGNAAFVGDVLMGGSDTALVAPPEGELGAYLRTLDRLDALGTATLYPAHGEEIGDPAAALERYRAHRRSRIRQVVEALREHPGSPPRDLLLPVYGAGLDPRLRSAALGSLQAILHYLETEGRATQMDDGFTLTRPT